MSTPSPPIAHGAAYRPDIDGLRAISVLGVLIFHVGATWLPGGFVGVDVFFVISGFLITGIIARECDEGRFTYAAFYERRVRRIYPALLIVLVATLAAAWWIMIPAQFRDFGRTLVWTPLFASNFAFMGQTGYFDPDGSVKPLLHTWSLGVEEQFYIVFPLLLAGVARFGLNRTVPIVAIVVASLAASVVSGLVGYGDGYFLLPIRFWELGAGALLALKAPGRASSRVRSGLGVAGLAAIGLSMGLIDSGTAFPGWVAVLPVVGAVAVLASDAGPVRWLLSTAPMTFIGRISYPMYLWHWPLIVFTQMYFFHPTTAPEAVGVVIATIVLSWATLVLVERPIRSRAVLGSRRGLFAAAVVGSVALVLAGLAVFNLKSLNRWTSPEQEALVAAAHDAGGADERCRTATVGGIGTSELCRIGLRGPGAPAPVFALLGDSHANAVAGTISEIAARHGLSGLDLSRIACPPLFGIDRVGDEALRCAAHLDAALAEIRKAGIRRVIIVSRWALPVTGHDYARSPAEVHPILRGGRRVAEADRGNVVAAALSATLDALGDRDVVVVDSIPEVRFDVPNVMANALRLGRPEPKGPTRAEFEQRQRDVRPLLRRVVAGRARVRIVEPADVLCDARICGISRDGRSLYGDADHLSRLGAGLLTPVFEAALGVAVGRP